MLRIKVGTGTSAPMPQPETQLPDSPDQEPDADDQGGPSDNDSDDDDNGGGDDSDKIDPQNAGYQGPDQGPFICANCQFFDNGHCEVVAGPIDHLGCCNNFTSLSGQQGSGQPSDSDAGGNTIGDQSNGAQSSTAAPTGEPDESEMA